MGKEKNRMFRGKSLVIEVKDNFYDVCIDMGDVPIFYNVVGANDADMALCSALEYKYGDCDFDYMCCSAEGVCYMYDVEVIDDVE